MEDYSIKQLSKFEPGKGKPDLGSAFQFSVEDFKGEPIGFINQHGDVYYVMHVYDSGSHYYDDVVEFQKFLRANWPLAYYHRNEVHQLS